MKRLSLLLLALFAGPLAHAEWLTLTGSAGEAGNTYVQVDPTSVVVEGSKRLVAVRISLAEPRTGDDGLKFRSVAAKFIGRTSASSNSRTDSGGPTKFGCPK